MNNEDFERKAEFILNQQARFSADMQRLEESQAETSAGLDRLSQDLTELRQDVTELTQDVTELTEGVSQLADTVSELSGLTLDGFKFTVGGFNELDAKINILIDSQILTQETMRHLAATVDRHMSEGHHGA